jgi:TonB family protein
MSEPSRVPPDSGQKRTPEISAPSASKDASQAYSTEIQQVARTLAAHGGGEASLDLALDLVLNDIVEQARLATGAAGAAIALERDGEMVCRAATGTDGPELGDRIEMASGLSGACLRTGAIQQCPDTQADPQTNAGARAGVRSIVMIPMKEGERVFGILAAFSGMPNAFGEREVSALQALAARATAEKKGAAAQEEAGIKAENFDPRATRAEIATGEFGQVQAEGSGLNDAREGDGRREGDRREDLAREYEVVGPESRTDRTVVVGEVLPPPRQSFWTPVLGVLIVLVALAIGLALGWRGASKASRQMQGLQRPTPGTLAANQNQSTQPPVSGAQTAETTGAENSASGTRAAAKSDDAPAPAAANGGLVITENGQVIFRSPRPSPGQSSSTQSIPSSSGAQLQSGETARLIHRVQPQYPAEARAQHIQGRVVLQVQIAGDGTVENVTVSDGNPMLADAAVQAVWQWRFQPSLVDGKPVAALTRVTVRFELPPG